MKLPRLWHGTRRGQLAALVGNGLLQAAVAVGLARVLSVAVDAVVGRAQGAPALGELLAPLATAIGLGAGLALLRWHERALGERLAQGYVHRVRMRLLRKVGRVAPAVWQRQSRGGLLLRFFGDMTSVGQWLSLGLSRSLSGAALTVGLVAGFLLTSPALALLPVLLGVPALLLAWLSTRALDAAVIELRTRRAALASRVSERIVGDPIVACGGDLRLLQRALRRQSRRVRDAAIDARARSAGVRAGLEFIALLATPLAVCALAWNHAAPGPSAGDITATFAIAALLATPLRDLSRVFDSWRRGRIALAKLAQFLALPEQRQGRLRFSPGEPALAVQLEQLQLDADLAPFDLMLEPGDRVQLQLPRGAARARLIALLLRTGEALAGRALFDGQPLQRYRLEDLRHAVAVAGPNTLVPGARDLDTAARHARAIERAAARAPRLLVIDGIDGGGAQELRETVRRILATTSATVLLLGDDPSLRREVDISFVPDRHPSLATPDIRSISA